jgi:hypothetical protein
MQVDVFWAGDSGPGNAVCTWEMGSLQKSLIEKHSRTVWVDAETRTNSEGREEFLYTRVHATSSPLVANFGTLIEIAAVTMDFTLSQLPSGRARDHGYLFKIHERNMDLLFPPAVEYDLTELRA